MCSSDLEHYLTIHQQHWDRALTLTAIRPPTCLPITAISEDFSTHHEREETNVLIGGDGLDVATQYPRQDSNL